MELKVAYKSAENHCGKLRLTKEDTTLFENVWDIKKVLEETLSTPVCDQKLIFQGRVLENAMTLKELYLRSGDKLQMEYLASGNLEPVLKLVLAFKEFLDQMEMLGYTSDDGFIRIVNELALGSGSNLYYPHLISTMEQVAFDFFIPWNSLKTQVNRHYFVQEGGFDNFLKVFRFSSKQFTCAEIQASAKIVPNIQSFCDMLNSNQRDLQCLCLSLLWNFSETAENRLLVIEQGGLTDVMNAFIKEGPTDRSQTNIVTASLDYIAEVAVGCLVQYVEFAKVQEIVVNNEAVMNKLITMAHESQDLDYSLYTQQLAANTLFCCSCNPNTPITIAHNGLHKRVIQSFQDTLWNGGGISQSFQDAMWHVEGNMALQYFSCMFLGQIRACPGVNILQKEQCQIDEILDKFLSKYTPNQVANWEDEKSYIWISMLPFVHLAYAGGPPPTYKGFEGSGNNAAESSIENETVSKRREEYVDSSDCARPMHRSELLLQSGSCGAGNAVYVKLPVEMQHELKRKENSAQSEETSNYSSFYSSSPQSKVLEKSLLWPGSHSTQSLGLFSILHLLHSSDNARVMNQEGLVGFLICLQWFLSDPLKTELLQCIQKVFGPQNVPSLKILSKSVLARVHGLHHVFEL